MAARAKAGAAKAGAGAGQAGAKAAGGRSGGMTLLMGMAFGALLAFATPSAVLGGVLLAPALLAAVFDRQPKRPVVRVVFVAAAGFTFGPIWHLNMGGASMIVALDMLADPLVLGPAWLAGACGWALCDLLPLLLRAVADRQAASRIVALQAEAEALKATWDFEE